MLPPTYNEVVDPQGSRHDIGVNNNGFIPLSREVGLHRLPYFRVLSESIKGLFTQVVLQFPVQLCF